jgi:hypothetical protein
VALGDEEFWDGGLAYNNPVIAAWFEKDTTFDRGRPVACVISLGTGKFLGHSRGSFHPHIGAGKQIAKAALNTENTHDIFQESMSAQGVPYCRFDPEVDDRIGMAHWEKIGTLAKSTEKYLNLPVTQLRTKEFAKHLYSARHGATHNGT